MRPAEEGRRLDAKISFDAWVTAQIPGLRRYFMTRGAIVTDVDDLIQQTFLVFWKKRVHTQPGYERSFLFGIANRICLAYLRDRARATHHANLLVSQPLQPASCQNPVPQDHPAPIGVALQQLPPRMRQMVEMVHLDGHTYASASRGLGLSDVAVRKTVLQALKLLRRILSGSESFDSK